jgi:hypothetical protein
MCWNQPIAEEAILGFSVVRLIIADIFCICSQKQCEKAREHLLA